MSKGIRKNACDSLRTISKRTVIASFEEGSGTREWLEGLRDEQWAIVSFVPDTRLVCALVESDRGTQIHLALTLP